MPCEPGQNFVGEEIVKFYRFPRSHVTLCHIDMAVCWSVLANTCRCNGSLPKITKEFFQRSTQTSADGSDNFLQEIRRCQRTNNLIYIVFMIFWFLILFAGKLNWSLTKASSWKGNPQSLRPAASTLNKRGNPFWPCLKIMNVLLQNADLLSGHNTAGPIWHEDQLATLCGDVCRQSYSIYGIETGPNSNNFTNQILAINLNQLQSPLRGGFLWQIPPPPHLFTERL